jgi:putative DNA primase/helicase
MNEGCLEWQHDGLNPPSVVMAATSAYFDSQDVFGKWLEERCTLAPGLTTKPGDLQKDCRDWASQNGEEAPDPAAFASALDRTAGLKRIKVRGLRMIQGIGLRPPENNRWNHF